MILSIKLPRRGYPDPYKEILWMGLPGKSAVVYNTCLEYANRAERPDTKGFSVKDVNSFQGGRVKKKASLYTIYQPIVEIRTGRIMGYEALTRARGKQSSPETLFRHAYQDGSVAELDIRCIQSALHALPHLKKNQLLFINIEPFTLSHFFEEGRKRRFPLKGLSTHGRKIVFELTEGMKGRDFDLIRKAVSFLKKQGCRFAIDDVAGIGFKLFLLLSLKPHFLKIDISLVKDIGKNRLHRDLVKRIIALGRKTRSLVVAEGVETKRDLEVISRMGIPFAQGFYYFRPQKQLIKQDE